MTIKRFLILMIFITTVMVSFTGKTANKQTNYEHYEQLKRELLAQYPVLHSLFSPFTFTLTPSPKPAPMVMDKLAQTIACLQKRHIAYNPIITVIDYSLPSSQKRLWIFDLQKQQLLLHTYVSHGIRSGELLTTHFSNRYNSKASSMGVYRTEKAYYGREGLSLRLDGLDRGFNDNASGRAIVMHGGWYVEEDFIKRYGRPGRSWGCPAVPHHLSQSIIRQIQDASLLIIYYPSANWFAQSRFLNCDAIKVQAGLSEIASLPVENWASPREAILFIDDNHNRHHDDQEQVMTMSANDYEHFFHQRPPLNRMLRRQVNEEEFIALSVPELAKIADSLQQTPGLTTNLTIIAPQLIQVRGYYQTKMVPVISSAVRDITPVADEKSPNTFKVTFDDHKTRLFHASQDFVRWIGL